MASKIIIILIFVLLQTFTLSSPTAGYSSDNGILYKTTPVPNKTAPKTTENAGDKTDLGITSLITTDGLDGTIDPQKNITNSSELHMEFRELLHSLTQLQMDVQFGFVLNIMIYLTIVPTGFLIGYVIYMVKINPIKVTITQGNNFIRPATKHDEKMVSCISSRTYKTCEKKHAYTSMLRNTFIVNQMEGAKENNIDEKFDNIV